MKQSRTERICYVGIAVNTKTKFRVFAYGTHCAAIDVFAESPEEAEALAREIDGANFDIVHLHGGKLEILDVEPVDEADESDDMDF